MNGALSREINRVARGSEKFDTELLLGQLNPFLSEHGYRSFTDGEREELVQFMEGYNFHKKKRLLHSAVLKRKNGVSRGKRGKASSRGGKR